MDGKSVAAGLLALLWGVGWAWALWETGWGRFIRLKRTWLSVVVGVGVDLLLMGLVVELRVWVWLVGIVGLSALGIVARCLETEFEEHREAMAEGATLAGAARRNDGGR